MGLRDTIFSSYYYYCALFSDVAASPVRGKEPSIATANNIDTLLGATESSEIVQPPEAVQDKVHFIFNNISQATLHQKVSRNNLWDTAEVVEYPFNSG